MRGVPCAWVNDTCDLVIGAGAVVDPVLLGRELDALPDHVVVTVDENAAVVTHDDGELEKSRGMFEAIGSTNEGVGVARARKMSRRREVGVVLAKHWAKWHPRIRVVPDTQGILAQYLRSGADVMLEGTQGSGLSLHHGTEWPFTTSADTNVSGLAADAGIAPAHIEHTFLVARTLPIRVAGNSGPMGGELGWDDLIKWGGVEVPEQTTVTKRVRRISRWDDPVFRRAVDVNQPCGVFLMFADYLVPAAAGTRDEDELWAAAEEQEDSPLGFFPGLVMHIEEDFRVPIVAFGTGGDRWSLAFRAEGRCAHGVSWST